MKRLLLTILLLPCFAFTTTPSQQKAGVVKNVSATATIVNETQMGAIGTKHDTVYFIEGQRSDTITKFRLIHIIHYQ